MNTKCPQCGMVNWQTATECKRCRLPLGANAGVYTSGASAGAYAPGASAGAYAPGDWSSPYAPPPPPQFVNGMATQPFGYEPRPGVWREKSTLVMDKNATLPPLCVKCGEPVFAADFERKLRWHHPAVYLLVLLNWLIYLIVALCVRKRATIYVGLCDAHRAKRRTALMLSWALVIIGLVLITVGLSNDMPGLAGLGALNLLGALIYAAVAVPVVRVKKMGEQCIWLNGVDQSYLAQLPEWRGGGF